MNKNSFIASLAFSASLLSANDLQQLTQRAEQGEVDAQIKLAEYYGDTTQKHLDSKKAFEWFKKAADQGDKYAQRETARRYLLGRGVKFNLKAGWYYLKQSRQIEQLK